MPHRMGAARFGSMIRVACLRTAISLYDDIEVGPKVTEFSGHLRASEV